jgi:hypothetical protein
VERRRDHAAQPVRADEVAQAGVHGRHLVDTT